MPLSGAVHSIIHVGLGLGRTFIHFRFAPDSGHLLVQWQRVCEYTPLGTRLHFIGAQQVIQVVAAVIRFCTVIADETNNLWDKSPRNSSLGSSAPTRPSFLK